MTDWTKKDLDGLIGVPESSRLEFKSTRLLADKARVAETLTKGVSAFANAEGGTIIVGLEESAGKGQRVATSISPGVSPEDASVTWLTQVIQDNISPPIPGLRVHPIAIGDLRLSLDSTAQRLAFAIEIPRSQRAVQAKDNIYYLRQEDRSLPMRAFQVDDVNNRSDGPDIELLLRPRADGPLGLIRGPQDRSERVVLEVVARNHSDVVAELALFHLIVPREVNPSAPNGWEKPPLAPSMILTTGGEFRRQAIAQVRESFFKSPEPALFKGMAWRVIGVFSVDFKNDYEHSPHYEPVVLVAEAPKMQPKTFEFALRVGIGGEVAIERLSAGDITVDDVAPLDYFASL
ncbi:MAG: ATP-binding protein [Chloroflexi bacterium]|nr:ATP-binding protein [Chloroflexota bacterium]MCI0816392.1 ATP-binding protein [Chloroflexota bacterium]MCI0889032.1 ATP-binding protein [Chloroflexota bacterium]